jgi:hypothetical protein
MRKIITAVLMAAVSLSFLICPAEAATLAQTYSGRIIIDPQTKTNIWYVNPVDHLRYSLTSAADVSALISKFGVGISEVNFQKIAQGGTTPKGDVVLAQKLSGKIIIEVERKGEIWYVNPLDLKKYPLGSPANAISALLRFGATMTQANLVKIPKAFKDDSANVYSNYKFSKKIPTTVGTFYADVVEVDLAKLIPRVITDTAGVDNCSVNCPAKPLVDYITNQKAFAAIPGVYGAPFYNTLSRRMVNENKLSSVQPLIAFDENNKFYYYPASNQFSAKNFSVTYGVKLAAAFAGRNKLVENGAVKAVPASVKTVRNAFGFKKSALNPQGAVFLVSVRNVTLYELARVMKSMGMDYAVSLDSGAYNALYYHDEYKIGPGSGVTSAILFAAK